MTPTTHKFSVIATVLAILVWTGVGWVWFNRQNLGQLSAPPGTVGQNTSTQDRKLAESYTAPTTAPSQKDDLKPIAPSLDETTIFEPARVLKVQTDSLEVVTSESPATLTVSTQTVNYYGGRLKTGSVEITDSLDPSTIQVGQEIYLVRNQLGIIEKIIVTQ